MRKITDFIVSKRNYILVLFLVLTIGCLCISNRVNINHDITKYLPNDSETKIGKDIMENEFPEMQSSSLNIMFADLNEEEKENIKNELLDFNGVGDIKSESKDEYVLYTLTINYASKSKEASSLYQELNEKYEDYDVFFGGEVANENKEVLHLWIVLFAIFCAMIILIIMCNSYIEPFLFLFTIGMAVFINKGTNIFFPSVSNITDSITAILQMALSMDYSIMLMNRYLQEKQNEKDKVKAMKNALYNSFKSISSSSVTTIVGLLALIFMSFTIGRDLGFVLAKGVLLSLVCIFMVLPGLIIMFDSAIMKTQKKSVHISLNKLGNFSYKVRHISSIVIVLLFIFSYLLKGNLQILYTGSEQDEIANVFNETNQMALVYENKEEDFIKKLCNDFENNTQIETVVCYSNTLNDDLDYQEMSNKLKTFDSSFDIDNYLLKLIYYNYYKKTDIKISYNDFINFVKGDILNNNNLKSKIDNSVIDNLNLLQKFTSKKSINTLYNKQDLSAIFGIDENKVNDLLIYYNSKNTNTKISLDKFIVFLNKDVLTNKKYSSNLNDETKEQIKMLSQLTNKNIINKKMNTNEISSLFSIDREVVDQLFLYYCYVNSNDLKLSINEFSNFILNTISKNEKYQSYFNQDTIENIKLLSIYSDSSIITKKMNSIELANLTGVSSQQIDLIMTLYFSKLNINDTSQYLLTPYELINIVLSSEQIMGMLPQNNNLSFIKEVMDSSLNGADYDTNSLSNLLNMDSNLIAQIYILYKSNDLKLSPNDIISLIINNQTDSMINNSISQGMLDKINLIGIVFKGINENRLYSYTELANLLGLPKDKVSLLYSLYDSTYLKKKISINLIDFTNFVINDVSKNIQYKDAIDSNSLEKLISLNNIMSSSLKDEKVNANTLNSNLNSLQDNFNKDLVELVYLYYGSVNNYNNDWKFTVENFVGYINDIANDKMFKEFINDEIRDKLKQANTTLNESKNLLVTDNYSRVILNTNYALEDDEVFDFIKDIHDKVGDREGIYLVGDSAMAYEMSNSFAQELDFITILTMLFIFVVVAITFKSIIIPLILVLLIQSAVYITMSILSLLGGSVYFISLLIVQSILMGATIDYAILYTSYYIESRKEMGVKQAVINSYNRSIHTILTSASILIIVTLIVGFFASAIAAKICKTLSQGTLCSVILILLILPSILALCDKFIIKDKK